MACEVALQSILAADVLIQRLLEVGGRNSVIARALAELVTQTPTKGDVACWTKHYVRGIITKIDKRNQTATIHHMVVPPQGKVKNKTISLLERTLVARKLPKAIAKIEGFTDRLADGQQHDVIAALSAIVTAGRTPIHTPDAADNHCRRHTDPMDR